MPDSQILIGKEILSVVPNINAAIIIYDLGADKSLYMLENWSEQTTFNATVYFR